jgi:hypothetical protein
MFATMSPQPVKITSTMLLVVTHLAVFFTLPSQNTPTATAIKECVFIRPTKSLAKPFVVPLGTVVTFVFGNTVHCTYNTYQPAKAMYINNVCQSDQYKQWLLNPLLCRQMYAYWQCCSPYLLLIYQHSRQFKNVCQPDQQNYWFNPLLYCWLLS